MRVRAAFATSVALFALLGTAPAGALSLAFTASLTLSYRPTEVAVPIVFPTLTGGGVATVNGLAPGGLITSLALPAGAISMAVSEPFASAAVQALSLSARNGAGTFAFAGGAGGGVMPLFGVAKICAFAPCATASAVQSLPLGGVVGSGGSAIGAGFLGNYTVIAAPWTIATATLINGYFTAMGSAHGPLSNTGTTAQPGGTLSLVTPG
jgi:hypothetical protein